MLIYIEGNIGTGKTTFINLLKKYLHKFNELELDGRIVLEPVDEWLETKDSSGSNILDKFYKDQEKWSFPFQMNSFISRVKYIQDEISKNDEKIKPSISQKETLINNYDLSNIMEKLIFVERSIYTDRNCFAKLCYESGKMTELEYNIYCKWNEWLSDHFNVKPDAYIYLRCLPEVNEDRIKQRNREEESSIPLDYLRKLHEKHDNWMESEKDNVPVLVINALDNFKDPEKMNEIFNQLFDFVKSI